MRGLLASTTGRERLCKVAHAHFWKERNYRSNGCSTFRNCVSGLYLRLCRGGLLLARKQGGITDGRGREEARNPPEKPPRQERGVWFRFNAKADFPNQMEVVRWLRNDPRYRVVTIEHNRDHYDEEEDGKEITLGDGTKVTVHAGEVKPLHTHGIVRLGSKITAASLVKRFGGYLHFELLHDPAEAAAYMLHRTFNSQHKVQYEYTELLDDVALWDELQDAQRQDDVLAVVRKVSSYRDDKGAISVERMLEDGDTVSLRSLIAHSYFYKSFVDKSNKKEG